jgi:hypothetical protein
MKRIQHISQSCHETAYLPLKMIEEWGIKVNTVTLTKSSQSGCRLVTASYTIASSSSVFTSLLADDCLTAH